MVCTRCFTYNQAPYIEDALRGFAMQETTFPIVTVIVDDASTDGEPDVLRNWANDNLDFFDGGCKNIMEYGELIFGHLRSRNNSWVAILLLSENHYSQSKPKDCYIAEWWDNSKYHAFCEGDDYWIHPMKLQRQVDFMESHIDYTLCFNNALVTYDCCDKPAIVFNQIREDQEVGIAQLLDKWICPTPGILVRSSTPPRFSVKGRIISGDWRLTLHYAACGKVWAMKAVMACYRKTDNGTSLSNTFSRRSDEAFLKKVPILEGLDEYTEGRYHDLISKYVRYYTVFGKLVQFKKQHGLFATIIMRPFSLIEIVWKRTIRPRLDKNAPTFSA